MPLAFQQTNGVRAQSVARARVLQSLASSSCRRSTVSPSHLDPFLDQLDHLQHCRHLPSSASAGQPPSESSPPFFARAWHRPSQPKPPARPTITADHRPLRRPHLPPADHLTCPTASPPTALAISGRRCILLWAAPSEPPGTTRSQPARLGSNCGRPPSSPTSTALNHLVTALLLPIMAAADVSVLWNRGTDVAPPIN
jgi:hypothetical protein